MFSSETQGMPTTKSNYCRVKCSTCACDLPKKSWPELTLPRCWATQPRLRHVGKPLPEHFSDYFASWHLLSRNCHWYHWCDTQPSACCGFILPDSQGESPVISWPHHVVPGESTTPGGVGWNPWIQPRVVPSLKNYSIKLDWKTPGLSSLVCMCSCFFEQEHVPSVGFDNVSCGSLWPHLGGNGHGLLCARLSLCHHVDSQHDLADAWIAMASDWEDQGVKMGMLEGMWPYLCIVWPQFD